LTAGEAPTTSFIKTHKTNCTEDYLQKKEKETKKKLKNKLRQRGDPC
jgi:hypothetical protein